MLLVILPRNQITMRFETVTCVWFLLAANVLHAIESNAWVLIAGRYFQLQPGNSFVFGNFELKPST